MCDFKVGDKVVIYKYHDKFGKPVNLRSRHLHPIGTIGVIVKVDDVKLYDSEYPLNIMIRVKEYPITLCAVRSCEIRMFNMELV